MNTVGLNQVLSATKMDEKNKLTSGISVVVCCYNSAANLPQTIKYLAQQQVDKVILWEIIIIDNNSTDNTRQVALEEWRKYSNNINFRIVGEPKSGLSFARERGIKEAQYSYLLFCDDDNWLYPDYIQNVFGIMENDPKIGMLGGSGIPETDKELPKWFHSRQNMFAVGSQSGTIGDISSKGYVYGAGCVIRLDIWKRILNSGVDLLLTGRKGNLAIGGEDNEMGYLIASSGYKIYYDPNLQFKHFIKSNRLNLQYMKELVKGHAEGFEIIYSYMSWISKGKNVRGYRRIGIDLISSFFQFIILLLIPNFVRRLSYGMELRFTYHKHRMIQILKKHKAYPELHAQVEKNMINTSEIDKR